MRSYLLAATAAGLMSMSAPAAAAGLTDRDETNIGVDVAVPSEPTGIRDEAMMVLVGSVLIGLAAAVRRAA